MKKMVSVIVPVYNVEKYLPTCIESILKQSYRDYELILVDDGSTDACPKICDTYAERYSFISVVHKKNGGLSEARNVGIEVANGDYVTFIDSDDYVHPFYLECLVCGIIDKNADISIVEFKSVYDSQSIEFVNKSDIKVQSMDNERALSLILRQIVHDVSACGILLPLALAKKYPYPVGKYYEDLYTTYKYYLSSNRVAVICYPLYYYLQKREGSIMNVQDERFFDLVEASKLLVEKCNISPLLKKAALSKMFSNYCRLILTMPDLNKTHKDVYNEVVKFLRASKFDILFDFSNRKKNRIAAFSLFFGINGLRWLDTIKRCFV